MTKSCKYFSGGVKYHKPASSFAKGTFFSLMLAACTAFAGCSDKAEELAPQGTRALDVQVSVQPTSRAMVKGTALAEGAGLGEAYL